MDFIFILVEPAVPENIGASARAMKTMGFDELRLVNPCEFMNAETKKLAHGSYEIIEKARVFNSLAKATEDCHFTIATSAKHRRIRHDYYQISEVAGLLKSKENIITKAGIIFGREERGLDNNELQSCDIVCYVPMKTVYPSLNLAQAVMVCAYELAKTDFVSRTTNHTREENEYISLRKKVSEYLRKNQVDRNQVLYNRILERLSLLKEDDIHLLHSIYKHIDVRQ
ncbi:MAG: tRNA/rRNA methyltransferase [Bacteroidales bacterium]|nr:tRNA/rRNA methyltransferase [Bacteroidales bacterium]